MALTLLYGWTGPQLIAELEKAQKDYLSGTMLLSGGSGDVNRANSIQKSAEARILAIQEALYELDPTTYADFALTGHSTTLARFS